MWVTHLLSSSSMPEFVAVHSQRHAWQVLQSLAPTSPVHACSRLVFRALTSSEIAKYLC
jgi:hypothetical protein